MSVLTSWLMNPWLLGASALAVALPILIHLLNRRRYVVVDWAAMDFLLAAEKQNRRRLRLENVSLLVLRCLAVLLVGLLLARPFLPSHLAAGLVAAARQERIVILDDSLSMQAQLGTETAFERARRRLISLCQQLAAARVDNRLTVVLASKPHQPALDSVPLQEAALGEIIQALEKLEPTDGRAPLVDPLESIETNLTDAPSSSVHSLYVLSDMRQIDWTAELIDGLEPLRKKVQALTIIDCADDGESNLTITAARPDGLPIAGLPLPVEITAKNQGRSAAVNLHVSVRAGPSLPLEARIARLAAQESASVRVSLPLPDWTGREGERSMPERITATIAATGDGVDDRLEADSTAYLAANVRAAVRVLLVDGQAGADYGQSESFYLQRALVPAGPVASGLKVQTIAADALEASDIEEFDVVFLLNTSHLGPREMDTAARLAQWVSAGGGLVVMPGDQADARHFNALLGSDGAGLSPLQLEAVRGDVSAREWASLQVTDGGHPVMRAFSGPGNPLLSGFKVFRWWHAATDESDSSAHVLARLSDANRSPAIVEKRIGTGRCLVFCLPADADWSNWPAEPGYVLLMQDLVRYLAAQRETATPLVVGQPLHAPVDITEYETKAVLRDPRGNEQALAAAPAASTDATSGTKWQFEYTDTSRQGFYELRLQARDGGAATRLWGVNVDPEEGDLRRAAPRTLAAGLEAKRIELVSAADEGVADESTASRELSRYLVAVVVAVLFSEQVLAWYMGRRRS